MTTVCLPETIDGLFCLLGLNDSFKIMAGGTDLLVTLRNAGDKPRQIIGLEQIPVLSEIYEQPDGGISIGACVSFSRIVQHPALRERYPLLTQAASTVGGPAIRNMATIGGNIATASPAADSLPALYLLDAQLELCSKDGCRTVAINDFVTGPRRTVLQPGEIITRIILPPQDWAIQRFEKVGRRKSLAIAVASMAAVANLADNGRVSDARFAWGSVGPTVVRCPAAEALLAGQFLTEKLLREAAAMVQATVAPIDDIRASADYRRTVAGNLMLRLVS